MQHALLEQREAGSDVHLALQELQAGDLALGLPVAPLGADRRLDWGLIPSHGGRELPEFREPALIGSPQPGVERVTAPLPHQAGELVCQGTRRVDIVIRAQQVLAVELLLGRKPFHGAQQEPAGLTWGRHTHGG